MCEISKYFLDKSAAIRVGAALPDHDAGEGALDGRVAALGLLPLLLGHAPLLHVHAAHHLQGISQVAGGTSKEPVAPSPSHYQLPARLLRY